MPDGFLVTAATPDDHDDLFTAFSRIVEDGDGFPQNPPLLRHEFDEYWLAHSSVVAVARTDSGQLAGAYYLKPNFVGRASHIANAGYFVVGPFRRRGLGRSLVLHSLEQGRRLGFDALQFNLVFETNPARTLYEELGFSQIGRVPRAVEDEDALIYWRAL
ncbi:MAG TPA: GNAT family N-acetyltransferase [Acidimicrobiales bacterium]|nr:GNAT family N-acetyltransferase [Acidimicrobiales bacterium]